MSPVHPHAAFTIATFPAANWRDAEPLLETWKSMLQALPGYIACEMWIRRLDNGDVRCVIGVTFEHREQLEEFQECEWAAEVVIATLDPPPYDVQVEHPQQHV